MSARADNVIVLDEQRAVDASTWAAFRGGDRRAAAEVWRREAPWLRRLLYRLVGPAGADDLDDLTQDVFLILQRELHALDVTTPMRGFLVGLAVNVARRRLRSAWRWGVVRRALPFSLPKAVLPTDPSAPRVFAELFEALETLEPEERLAFSLRYLEQQSLTEVAESLDVSLATVKRRLRGARLHLIAQAARFPTLAATLDGGSDED
ncbi:MAG: sigma-70 family RNA polymerase sigma factor [Myxococcaceae bacterium]|nr:sigma-70 family RNA polymerase sigma factor [Myxococcaceae bacterium]